MKPTFFLIILAINTISLAQNESNEFIQNKLDSTQQTKNTFPSDSIFFLTDEGGAQFPGGPIAFQNWIAKNLTYPTEAIQQNIEGKVWLQFLVNKEGEISDIKILKGVHPLLNDECIRVLSSSPLWIPAEVNGRVVKSYHRVPISFVLEKSKKRNRRGKV
jgi:TonB family protein